MCGMVVAQLRGVVEFGSRQGDLMVAGWIYEWFYGFSVSKTWLSFGSFG